MVVIKPSKPFVNSYLVTAFLIITFIIGLNAQRPAPYSTELPAPNNVVASDGKFPSKVSITWNPAPDLPDLKYMVYRSKVKDISKMEPINMRWTPGNKATDRQDLEPGVTYYYSVRASYNSQEMSAYSEIDSGYIVIAANPPEIDTTNDEKIKQPRIKQNKKNKE